jgi:hypothetical protein
MIGERVVCIKEEVNYPQLKIGKLFTVTDKVRGSLGVDLYKLISDKGEKVNWIDHYYFKTLSELREEKLKELGIV